MSGWEGADWYAPEGVEPKIERLSWGRQNWFEYWRAEHEAARNGVIVMDMSFMSKFLVQGRDAGRLLNHLSANDVDGGLTSVTSPYGNLEQPVNPLLYVLAYGAPFVAQGTPADMPGLAKMIEEGIRFPGFAFINVQSPCVTYGEEEQQVKAQKAKMKSLASLNHDPANLLAALDLARAYGTELYTGVLYRNPQPPSTMDSLVRERQTQLALNALPREKILDLFVQK